MKLLLDTHTFIRWDSDPGQHSAPALTALRDPANSVWFSVVSIWEIVIKVQLGKLTVRLPVSDLASQQQANGLHVIPVMLSHTLAVETLPPIHKDSFDRLLGAQSIVQGADLVSADAIFRNYPVRLLW